MNGRLALGQDGSTTMASPLLGARSGRWSVLVLALGLGLAVFGASAEVHAAPAAAPAKAPAKPAAPPPRAHRAPAKPRAAQTAATRAASSAPTPSAAPAPAPRAAPEAPVRAAATGAAPADAAVIKTEEARAGERTYTFGAQEVEGRLKSPQILYFLRRVRAEFDPAPLGHRSFLLELYDTRRHRALE